jgi:hypothetical protein
MRKNTIHPILFFFLIHFAIVSNVAACEETTVMAWHTRISLSVS